jgi:hypothetical protein
MERVDEAEHMLDVVLVPAIRHAVLPHDVQHILAVNGDSPVCVARNRPNVLDLGVLDVYRVTHANLALPGGQLCTGQKPVKVRRFARPRG